MKRLLYTFIYLNMVLYMQLLPALIHHFPMERGWEGADGRVEQLKMQSSLYKYCIQSS